MINLRYINIHTSDACQLACSYCYNEDSEHHLTFTEHADTAIDFLYKYCHEYSAGKKRASASFMGGEPTIHWQQIAAVLERAKSRHPDMILKAGMTSNCVFMPEEMLQWANSEGVHIHASADGCRQAHDITRRMIGGSSSFNMVEASLKRLLAINPKRKSIRSTYTKKTAALIPDSINYFLSLGFQSIIMVRASSATDEPWSVEDLGVLEDAMQRSGDIIFEQMQAGRNVRVHSISKCLDRIARGRTPEKSTCGAGGNGYVGIDVLGRIIPCHRFCGALAEEYACGTIATTPWVVDFEKLNSFLDTNHERFTAMGCDKCPSRISCENACPFHYCAADKNPNGIRVECEASRISMRVAESLHKRLMASDNLVYAANYCHAGQ